MAKKPSVIDMANAAYAIHPQSQQQQQMSSSSLVVNGRPRSVTNGSSTNGTMISLDDRLDAARSLLGISPCSVADSSVAAATTTFGGRLTTVRKPTTNSTVGPLQLEGHEKNEFYCSQEVGESTAAPTRRARSNSAGLDALALLATQQQEESAIAGSSSTNRGSFHEALPTVPQRRLVPLLQPPSQQNQPSSNNTVITSSSDDDSEAMPPPPPRRRRSISNPEGMEKYAPRDDYQYQFKYYRTLVLPASILEEELAEASAAMKAKEEEQDYNRIMEDEHHYDEEDDDEQDEEKLDPEELLRRARSRLFEDLSQSNLNGEKGVLTLPHSLEKYKEVYNKKGRIGIYTPAERAAIIARFQSKRSRRVWNKKIRYNCRKNLADRRLRVKGRFVKRSTLEEEDKQDYTAEDSADCYASSVTFAPETKERAKDKHVNGDADMPDVNDPDAGFCPTDDQPYRRLRRHTIT